jgi:hypothetical protein
MIRYKTIHGISNLLCLIATSLSWTWHWLTLTRAGNPTSRLGTPKSKISFTSSTHGQVSRVSNLEGLQSRGWWDCNFGYTLPFLSWAVSDPPSFLIRHISVTCNSLFGWKSCKISFKKCECCEWQYTCSWITCRFVCTCHSWAYPTGSSLGLKLHCQWLPWLHLLWACSSCPNQKKVSVLNYRLWQK